ncbi:MAG: NAD-dependent succinate-semialdehyde dehydrogenase [Alphaproteobacteria bacterium]|nr:MAG: NAD-dependent succinate-semialdehyde dehydrogenase [Alphaproteobacteria bacterium]
MVEKLKLYINGEWREGAENDTIEVINPATEETVFSLCMAGESDIHDILAAADDGFKVWKNMPGAKRAGIIKSIAVLIRQRLDVMAQRLTIEQGKTLAEARGEILATASYFEELGELSERIYGRVVDGGAGRVERHIVQEPIGPVFGIAPWNLPAMMPGRKIANSLAAGCSIILKPAKETPATAYAIAKCCEDAGVPAGVVNVISGPSSLLSNMIIPSPVIRKVSFTGSTEVGKELSSLAGRHMKKVAMELGGHAPVIICEDADVEEVVNMTVPARFSNAGQSCMAATRFFVHEDIYDAFAAAFAARAGQIKVGNGLGSDVKMGPLASKRRLPVMDRLTADALDKGASLLAGGATIGDKGFFFEPTVLKDVPENAAIMTEEPFGPVTPIVSYGCEDEVIARANETPYGLAAYIFTNDRDRGRRLVSGIEAGLVGVNSMFVAGPSTPFGGVKDSGVGREGAMEGLLESMTTKTVTYSAS